MVLLAVFKCFVSLHTTSLNLDLCRLAASAGIMGGGIKLYMVSFVFTDIFVLIKLRYHDNEKIF